ncbi:MAG TPA: MarR family winged helix-turn-helix transcriptional regulator, partial [Hydrogenophaga sp.]
MSTVAAVSSAPVKPQGCTNLKLRQLVRAVGAFYDAEVGKAGLKITQYSLLSYITKLGPIRAVELAQQMHMSASTL